jgi:hypothetical protein
MLLVAALATPLALLGLLMAMAGVQDRLFEEPAVDAVAPLAATPADPPTPVTVEVPVVDVVRQPVLDRAVPARLAAI